MRFSSGMRSVGITTLMLVGSIDVSAAQASQASSSTHQSATTPRSSSSSATGRSSARTPGSGGGSSWVAGQGSFSAPSQRMGGTGNAGSAPGAARGQAGSAMAAGPGAAATTPLEAPTPKLRAPALAGVRSAAGRSPASPRNSTIGAHGGHSLSARSSGSGSRGVTFSPTRSKGRRAVGISGIGSGKEKRDSSPGFDKTQNSNLKRGNGMKSTSSDRLSLPSREGKKSPGRPQQ